jgi:hypothetical protein
MNLRSRFAIIGSEHIDTIINSPGVIANIPSLETASAGVGMTNTLPRLMVLIVRLPLFVGYNGGVSRSYH